MRSSRVVFQISPFQNLLALPWSKFAPPERYSTVPLTSNICNPVETDYNFFAHRDSCMQINIHRINLLSCLQNTSSDLRWAHAFPSPPRKHLLLCMAGSLILPPILHLHPITLSYLCDENDQYHECRFTYVKIYKDPCFVVISVTSCGGGELPREVGRKQCHS